MATPRKLDVLFAFFPYGGNGATASEVPQVRTWFADTLHKAKSDPRIGRVGSVDVVDTPITMSRNRAVREAREGRFDLLVMIDSDNYPDLYVGQVAEAQPFWDVALEAIYDHWEAGPLVIAAPYGGPPPNEQPYVFQWTNRETSEANEPDLELSLYSRSEAAQMAGLQPAAALATGVMMIDTRVFDFLPTPYFYYEWTDHQQSSKASTEDVTFTRDVSLVVTARLGYNPLRAAWDSWAGHWKPKCVGKPNLLTVEVVSERIRQAIVRGVETGDALRVVDFNRRAREAS